MRLLTRRRRMPQTKSIRPAERYLLVSAEEARRLNHSFIGTEHVLAVLLRQADSATVRVLAEFGVSVEQVRGALACWLEDRSPTGKIDPAALASLGIDFDAVRERLDRCFGPGALERTRSGCLGIAPRLKVALAFALDYAGGSPLGDQHVLLGMLSVPESAAARVLGELGVTLERAEELAAS